MIVDNQQIIRMKGPLESEAIVTIRSQAIQHLNPSGLNPHRRAIELLPSPPLRRGLYPMSHLPQRSLPRSPPPRSLYKLYSWSPDSNRDEAWLRRKVCRNRRSKSLTDEDLNELKACIELGFGFDSSEIDQRLSATIPAYGLYYAINKNYNSTVSKQPPPSSSGHLECDTPSPLGSPHTILGPAGDNPQVMKTRLRQWAQLVACSVRQSPN